MSGSFSKCWLFLAVPCLVFAENNTDISLFLKEAPGKQVSECFSEFGDMYLTLGHHGPAIENEFVGFRMFFDRKAAIDVYSKTRQGLELDGAAWYPTQEQQADGWGGDYYHVGDTVGLGGIRLWVGEKVIPLDPVRGRYGRVVKEGSVSFMEIRSEGVPYRGREVDVLVRVTVFSNVRNAKIEAFALSGESVQFVTGLNHREDEQFLTQESCILSWAPASGGVASRDIEIGAALMFNAGHIARRLDDDAQALLISTPRKFFEYWISSANSKEPDLNTLKKFEAYISEELTHK